MYIKTNKNLMRNAIFFACLAMMLVVKVSAGELPNPKLLPQVRVESILNPYTENERIEFFSLKPLGEGPFPVLFLIHGSQSPDVSPGGKIFIDNEYLQMFAEEGIVAVAISMPGYGHSDGIRDFAGSHTQKAVSAVINHFSQLPFVDPKNMGIYGISLGAILSSLIHQHYPYLQLQILESGAYDLPLRKYQLPAYLEGILQNMSMETGGSDDALRERSAIYHTQNIQAKTLILQGGLDDRKGLPSAQHLHEILLSEGKNSSIEVFPHSSHLIGGEKWGTVLKFVREHFFTLYGIGVALTPNRPAIQIMDMMPGAPAERSGKIKNGDAILAISPNNDDEKMDTLNLPFRSVINLILGKKGTCLRLYVQHLDLSYEEITLERG